jgi:hypothetical protein
MDSFPFGSNVITEGSIVLLLWEGESYSNSENQKVIVMYEGIVFVGTFVDHDFYRRVKELRE